MYFILIAFFCLIPTLIAIIKEHPQKIPIILVNILLGWVWGIGWIIALIWCFIEPAEKSDNTSKLSDRSDKTANDIEQLHGLLEKGILTQEEFDIQKQKLLNQNMNNH